MTSRTRRTRGRASQRSGIPAILNSGETRRGRKSLWPAQPQRGNYCRAASCWREPFQPCVPSTAEKICLTVACQVPTWSRAKKVQICLHLQGVHRGTEADDEDECANCRGTLRVEKSPQMPGQVGSRLIEDAILREVGSFFPTSGIGNVHPVTHMGQSRRTSI